LLVGLTGLGAAIFVCGLLQNFKSGSKSRIPPKVAGKQAAATFSTDAFLFEGENQQSKIKWPGIAVRAESERMLILASGGRFYILPKRSFTKEQLNSLKEFLSALPRPADGSA
jgi:hypothetical protein